MRSETGTAESRAERFALRAPGGARADELFRLGTLAVAMLILVVLVALVGLLYVDARLALGRYGLDFVTSSTWDNVFEKFGALPYIYGTLVTSVLALLIATPIAVGAALYIAEYAPSWFRAPVAFLVELLAAIPSIIYGLWGFFVLAPIMRAQVEPFMKAVTAP